MTISIPYSKQSITERDIERVVTTLRSAWLTQGPAISEFEQAIADYCGAKYAVAFANATAALHVACMVLNVQPGDRVWTTPNSFVASANCARYCGAEIDFVDICPRTYNMSVDSLAEKLKHASQNNCLPKVIIPVHFAGQSCDMQKIKALADEYGCKLIEDASHALGGDYYEQRIGQSIYSDITVFSFHPVKMITTGEGGMIVTNDEQLMQRARLLRTHGVTRDDEQMRSPSHGPWYYQQVDLGYNYRISDIQAALGLAQLERLDEFVQERNALTQYYQEVFADLPLQLPYIAHYNHSSCHLYVVQIAAEHTQKTRLDVFNELRAQGLGVNVHYIPIHTQPYYQDLGFREGDFPVAERYYEHTITLPLYPYMSEQERETVVNSVRNIAW